MKPDDSTWAYIAGLFDGEGSLALYQNGPRMSISNRHKETLEWIKEIVGHGRVWENKSQSQFKRSAPCFQWDCGSRGIRFLLPLIRPFSRIHFDRIDAMLEYFEGVWINNAAKVSEEEKLRRESLKARINGRQIVWGNETGR